MGIRCWWFGCEIHPQDPSPIDKADCMHCGGYVEYSDMVGETRHKHFTEWCNYWLFRKWWPRRCVDCGHRWRHDETIDHIPF